MLKKYDIPVKRKQCEKDYTAEMTSNNNVQNIDVGFTVFNKFEEISGFYTDIIIDKFIIMPNHLHAIILIQHDGTAQGPFPTLAEYVKRFKTLPTKLYIDFVKKGEYPPSDI
jgi:hypothetical protein